MLNNMRVTRRHFLAGAAAAMAPSFISKASAESLPFVTVTKDPNCGCCTSWAEHIRAAGFATEVIEANAMDQLKRALGVPPNLASCHTAEVGGYVVEGHVPASALKRLLLEGSAATGLAVPGMPVDSPGMEMAGVAPEIYEVVLFGPSGTSIFARFRGLQEI